MKFQPYICLYKNSKSYLWEDISEAYTKKAHKWGLSYKHNFRYSLTTYNIFGGIGKNGIQLILKNNNQVFIGTGKLDELTEVFRKFGKL